MRCFICSDTRHKAKEYTVVESYTRAMNKYCLCCFRINHNIIKCWHLQKKGFIQKNDCNQCNSKHICKEFCQRNKSKIWEEHCVNCGEYDHQMRYCKRLIFESITCKGFVINVNGEIIDEKDEISKYKDPSPTIPYHYDKTIPVEV